MTSFHSSSAKFAAFRIPAEILDRVDVVCEQQDLTRSQFLRRSVIELLKQHPLDADQPNEPKLTWSDHWKRRLQP